MDNQTYLIDLQNLKNEIISYIKANQGLLKSTDICLKFSEQEDMTLKCLKLLRESNKITKSAFTRCYYTIGDVAFKLDKKWKNSTLKN